MPQALPAVRFDRRTDSDGRRTLAGRCQFTMALFLCQQASAHNSLSFFGAGGWIRSPMTRPRQRLRPQIDASPWPQGITMPGRHRAARGRTLKATRPLPGSGAALLPAHQTGAPVLQRLPAGVFDDTSQAARWQREYALVADRESSINPARGSTSPLHSFLVITVKVEFRTDFANSHLLAGETVPCGEC